MKRIAIVLSVAAIFWGCSQMEEINQPFEEEVNVDNLSQASGLPSVIHASVADDNDQDSNLKTRTYVNEQNKVLWHNADAISYFSGYHVSDFLSYFHLR